ncbi:hypothetical protein [Streptomyces sp. NPDC017435]
MTAPGPRDTAYPHLIDALDRGLLPAGALAQLLRPEAVAGPGQALA